MDRTAYWKIVEHGMTPRAREQTVDYLVEHLSHFLKKEERVLICFLESGENTLSGVMADAVRRCGGTPVLWESDHRWKTLLQQAFFCKVSAVIGPPLILLGLSKLMRQSRTPLFIRKVITAGYPCMDWMIDGLVKGFDCEVGGCFTLGESGVVAGFACGHSWGVHVREAEYGVDIIDREGKLLPDGEIGEIVLYSREMPELRYPMGENARLEVNTCKCGSSTPRLLDLSYGFAVDKDLSELGQYLQSWTSVLDCRLKKGEVGLEIEIICFAGEKLPKLPTAAKLVIRPWNPQIDEPFPYVPILKNAEK